MIGVYLNLILSSLAMSVLLLSVNFFRQKSGSLILRSYVLALGIITFFIELGYALTGFSIDLHLAEIPHFIGLTGINLFLILEVLFVLHELKSKTAHIITVLAFFGTYMFFDFMVLESTRTFLYVRIENLFTSYTIQNKAHFAFHYSFIAVIATFLFCIGVLWYKQLKVKHDRIFALRLIFANLILLISAVPEMEMFKQAMTYPYVAFCLCFVLVFYMWYAASSAQATYLPTISNTAAQVFSTIDTPILIFDLNGTLQLLNPSAKQLLGISEVNGQSLRSVLALTDVENLSLQAKAKQGVNTQWKTKVISQDKDCVMKCFVRFDRAKDPYCVIATLEVHNFFPKTQIV